MMNMKIFIKLIKIQRILNKNNSLIEILNYQARNYYKDGACWNNHARVNLKNKI